MTYFNNLGQARVGWRIPSGGVTPSTLWNSIYGVWNADTRGTSLDTSIFRVYNGDNVNDTSGNAQNGTNVGGVTFTTGKVGNALTFNGSNNYVNLGNDKFSFAGNFTISAWVNLNTVSWNKAIMSNLSYVSNISNGWLLLMRNNKLYFEFYKNNGTYDYLATNTNLTTSTWYHIIVVRVASQSTKIYINGVLDTSNSSTYNPTYTSTIPIPASIGAWKYDATNVAQFTNGKIDALNVWDKALTDNEVLSLYNEGTGAEYPFSSQTLPSLNDATPNANNGTRPATTLSGGVPGPSFTTGKIGKAFNFDGVNDFIELGDVMDLGLSSWSYSMWFNVSNTNNNMLFSKTILASNYGRIWAGTNASKVYFAFQIDSPNSNIVVETTTNINTNTWYHVTFVFDRNDKMQVYLNGVLSNLNTTSGTNNLTYYSSWNINTNNPFRIGAFTTADNVGTTANFTGKIDAFSVWNRVLTSTDVTDLYNSGTGKQYPN